MKSDKTGETHISLAHGNGGRFMRELIEQVFAHHLSNPLLDIRADAAPVPVRTGEIMITTDGFTVQPLEFPGGDIGSLAVHGTVNDLAVSGAAPLYLSLSTFIEEGMEIAQLERIVASLGRAAASSGVQVVAGDTKVVRRGEGGGLYIAVTGVGVRPPGLSLGMQHIREGDAIIVSGPVGDHGIAVMLAREQFGLRSDLQSDAASVLPLTSALLPMAGLRFMRDPTRGGLATTVQELSQASGLNLRVRETAIAISEDVRGICEVLGLDALYLACEGRLVAVVAPEEADECLRIMRTVQESKDAAVIGEVTDDIPGFASLETYIGAVRVLDLLSLEQLPRIC